MSSNYRVFAALFLLAYVNSSRMIIIFLLLNNWETDLQKSTDFLLNPFLYSEMICTIKMIYILCIHVVIPHSFNTSELVRK